MTFRDRFSYAFQDLFPLGLLATRPLTNDDRSARPWLSLATLGRCFYGAALALSLMVPLIAVSLIWSLNEGMMQWQRTQILKDPSSRRLTIALPGDNTEFVKRIPQDKTENRLAGWFHPEDLHYVRHRLAKEESMVSPPKGVFGYSEYGQVMTPMGENSSRSNTTYTGRSTDTSDPSYRNLTFSWRAQPTGDLLAIKPDGIGCLLIHQSLASLLKLDPNSGKPMVIDLSYNPNVINARTDENRGMADLGYDRVEHLEVTGIYTGDLITKGGELPLFYMTHQFVSDLASRAWYPTPYYHNVLWGPIADNISMNALPKTMIDWLDSVGIQAELVHSENARWLALSRKDGTGPLKTTTWESAALSEVISFWKLAELPLPTNPRIVHPAVTPLGVKALQPQFQKLAIDVDDLPQLIELGSVVDRLGLAMDGAASERVRSAMRVMNQKNAWEKVLGMVVFVTSLLATIGLFLALSQRGRQKTSEIGILRAFGANRSLIQSLFLTQTLIIWVIAAFAALVLTPVTYALLEPGFHRITDTSGKDPLGAVSAPKDSAAAKTAIVKTESRLREITQAYHDGRVTEEPQFDDLVQALELADPKNTFLGKELDQRPQGSKATQPIRQALHYGFWQRLQKFRFDLLGEVIAWALGLTLLATLLATWQAARNPPAEAFKMR
jgi:FtsX-like permease family